MTEPEWYSVTSRLATFAFAFVDGRVAICAPFGRKWLMGLTKSEARAALLSRGYRNLAR